jgi:transcriptional regulator with XRE-family HTH domain
MEKISKKFMSRLKLLRDGRPVSQFATASGIAIQTMVCYCKASREPGVNNLIKICQNNSVSADWLLGFTDERTGTAAPVADTALTEKIKELELELAKANAKIEGFEIAFKSLKR